MHGLMGDRLLKRFLKGIRRKSRFALTNEAEPKSGCETETTSRSDNLDNDPPQGKEEEENIEKTNNLKDSLDMTSGATQSLDDLEKRK
jgi:hypothetical protein